MHLAISRGSAALRVDSEGNFRSCGPSAPVADNFAEDIARIFARPVPASPPPSGRSPRRLADRIATPLGGETMLDGYYTGFLSDSQVIAERWLWVRVEPQSAEGVDVNTVVLGEPRRIYDAIVGRSPFDAPIPLEQLTENP